MKVRKFMLTFVQMKHYHHLRIDMTVTALCLVYLGHGVLLIECLLCSKGNSDRQNYLRHFQAEKRDLRLFFVLKRWV